MPEDLRRVVTDGFFHFQQSTFATHKRNSVIANESFRNEGGDLYVLTSAQRIAFEEASIPVQDWFRNNVDGGHEILDELKYAIIAAETTLRQNYVRDLN